MINLSRANAESADELTAAFRRVLASGRYILGTEVEAFEREAAEYLGVRFAVGVGNGTDALSLALMALGVGRGDEVVVPTFTFIASAETIAVSGATPVFADVDERTFNMTAATAERAITPKTRGIMHVHLFGQPTGDTELAALARERGLFLIEDAAQSFGAERDGHRAGTAGDVGTFSFYPTKNLSAVGDGGLCVTNDEPTAKLLLSLRAHGSSGRKYVFDRLGVNSRLDELQAAFLRVKLGRLDEGNERRRRIAAKYDGALSPYVLTPRVGEGCTHTYHQYCILTDRRDALREHLAERGVSSQIHYPMPLHLQESFAYLDVKRGSLPVAESASERILALPVSPEHTDEEIDAVVGAVCDFFGRG